MKLGSTSVYQSAGRILALIAFAFAWPMGANAQWEVINLHPREATDSAAGCIGDGQQAGYATIDGATHAVLWSGSARSCVDLHPGGMATSSASDVGGGQVVGSAFDGLGLPHASLWTGPDLSWVDLQPAGADASMAYDVDGSQVVGGARVDGCAHAGLWDGTAGPWVWVDLHPAGATESRAHGVEGDQQAGTVVFDIDGANVPHAGVWRGSADSWEDLHPAEAFLSIGADVDSGQVVGHVKVDGLSLGRFHASLWDDTAGSWVWVDLHPDGVNVHSEGFGVHGGQQVGIVWDPDPIHAALWSSSSESYVDLHAFLSKDFGTSYACDIWHDDTYTYVVGYGYNTKRGRNEALMWRAEHSPPPSPPVAQDDTYTTPADTALVVVAPGILGNDSDPNGDPIIAIWDSGPSHGTLGYLNEDGSFEYTPATGFTGTDAFTYTAFDGGYDSNVATVTITVGDPVGPGGITGTVTDAGGPVKKATVTAYDALGAPAATGKTLPSGAYTLAGLAPGEYTVEAVLGELRGWAPGIVTVLSGETTTGVDIFIE